MKYLLSLIFLGFLGSVTAEESCCVKQCLPDMPLPEYADQCSYLSPSRHCFRRSDDNYGIYLEADILFWQVRQRGLEYAVKDVNVFSLTQVQAEIINPEYHWQPGYRIFLGYNIPYDGWRASAYFTHIHTKSYSHVRAELDPDNTGGGGGGLISVWTHPQSFHDAADFTRWSYATANWKLYFNMLTVELDRAFCVGQYLTVRPHFGVKGGTIHQRYNISYQPGNTLFGSLHVFSSNVYLRNRTFGVGPFFGFASYWKAGDHWNFFGNLAGALLSTKFQLFHNQSDSSSFSLDSVKLKDEYWTYRPQAELALGITWSTCVGTPCKRTRYVGVSVSYEAQYWWKENEMIRYYDYENLGANLPTQAPLMMQGVTASLAFDF